MGLNFAALLRYGGSIREILPVIVGLEAGTHDSEFHEVIACGRQLGYAFADFANEPVCWRPRGNDWDNPLPNRPTLPTREASLYLPSGFDLTFGQDAILACHAVRRVLFLQEERWHPVILEAVDRFCALFAATDCVIAHDGHPLARAFFRGATFSEALDQLAGQDEPEVKRIEEMYIDAGVAQDLAYQLSDGTEVSVPLWDTQGFWRPPRFRSGSA